MKLLDELKNSNSDLLEEVMFKADRVVTVQLSPDAYVVLGEVHGGRVAVRAIAGTYDPVALCGELGWIYVPSLVADNLDALAYKVRFSLYAEEDETQALLNTIGFYRVVHEGDPLPHRTEGLMEFYLNALPKFQSGQPMMAHELATHVGITRALLRSCWA